MMRSSTQGLPAISHWSEAVGSLRGEREPLIQTILALAWLPGVGVRREGNREL